MFYDRCLYRYFDSHLVTQERKRKIKADKLEAQKAAGTYMTKAEKVSACVCFLLVCVCMC